MKRYWTGQQGLTLVELVAGLTIFLILLSAIVPLLSTSIQAWRTGRSQAEIQQTARLAMERLGHSVRYAKTVTVADHGGSLQVVDGDGSSLKFSVNPDTQTLCLASGNGTPQPFAGDGYNKAPGQVVVIANPGNQQRFTVQDVTMLDKNGQALCAIKQVRIVITVRDKMTGFQYTLQSLVVAQNS
jgi:prepilin-type N-terminal cleavage/methylation domain-containing protein